VKLIVVAVGRLRPPYADDVQHYQKLLAGHAKLELAECREDEQVARRIPKRSHVTLLSSDGEQYDSESFARVLEERRRSGRRWPRIARPAAAGTRSSPPARAAAGGWW